MSMAHYHVDYSYRIATINQNGEKALGPELHGNDRIWAPTLSSAVDAIKSMIRDDLSDAPAMCATVWLDHFTVIGFDAENVPS